jgi:hypothetical protein
MLLPACMQAKDAWEGTKQSAQETKDAAADKVRLPPCWQHCLANVGSFRLMAHAAACLQVQGAWEGTKQSAQETKDAAADKVRSCPPAGSIA